MSSKFSKEMEKLKGKWQVTVDTNMRDFSKEAFFLKKAAMADESLSKSKKELPNGHVLTRIEL
jgi:hypothetical protein